MSPSPPRGRPPRQPRKMFFSPTIKTEVAKVGRLLQTAVSPTTGSVAVAGTSKRELDRKNLGWRIVTGLIMAFVTIITIYLGTAWFAAEALFMLVVGVVEVCTLCTRKGLSPWVTLGVGGGVVIFASYSFAPQQYLGNIVAVTVVATLIAFLFRRDSSGNPMDVRFLDAVATIYAYLYTAWLFGFAMLLRREPGLVSLGALQLDLGAAYLYMLLITTAFSDIGCYAFGKAFGRRPLAPRVSPGKTLEGSMGGLLVSLVTSMLLGKVVGMPLWEGALYGLGVGLAAQLGDLWESAMKRDAGVKDSGRLIPGHGGVLDRFDSYFFSAPVAYLLIAWLQ